MTDTSPAGNLASTSVKMALISVFLLNLDLKLTTNPNPSTTMSTLCLLVVNSSFPLSFFSSIKSVGSEGKS
jgi:hypothetical protein